MRCPECLELLPTGCLCNIGDSDCLAWAGDGSEADPLTLEMIFSADPDNLATCLDYDGGGLSAELPYLIADPPSALAYNSANQSIPDDTSVAVILNQEKWDTDGMHDNSTNNTRITFTNAGTYCITFNCMWRKNPSVGDRQAYIRKNTDSAGILAFDSKLAGGPDLFVCHSVICVAEFTAGEWVEGVVKQTSGQSIPILTESHSPILAVSRV